MSAFDRRVMQWLNTASLPDKSKTTVLNRAKIGVNNYKAITNDTELVKPSVFRVDYGLIDEMSKGVEKIEANEMQPGELLFPKLVPEKKEEAKESPKKEEKREEKKASPAKKESAAKRPASTRTRAKQPAGNTRTRAGTPGASGGGKRTATPAKQSGAKKAQEQEEATSPKGDKMFVSFKFGEDSGKGEEAAAHHSDDEDVRQEEAHIDENEDRRRRATAHKRQSRHAISSEIVRLEEATSYIGVSVPKSQETKATCLKVLETHNLFSHLDDKDLQATVDIMVLSQTKKGTKLVEKGLDNGTFFIVVKGSCVSETSGQVFSAGSCFGEVGLMYEAESDETIVVQEDNAEICTVGRVEYRMICAKASHEKRERYEGFLANVKFLGGLTRIERLQLADALKRAKYEEGEYLIHYGEPGKWFNIIVEGTVQVVGRDKKGNKVNVCTFTVGECVGELEFLFNHDTVADVIAASPVVITAKMTARHFEKVIGPAKEVLERQANNDDVFSYYRNARKDILGMK